MMDDGSQKDCQVKSPVKAGMVEEYLRKMVPAGRGRGLYSNE